MIYTDCFYWRGTICGHLFTDASFEELHCFARSIGLRREWFQANKRVPHYDLIGEELHEKAIFAGALPCGRKEIIRNGLRIAGEPGEDREPLRGFLQSRKIWSEQDV